MPDKIQKAINTIAIAQTAAQKLINDAGTLEKAVFASTLTTKLMEAQNTFQEIQHSHTQLRTEIARLIRENRKLAELARHSEQTIYQCASYELTKIANGHCSAYAPQPEVDGVRSPPFLCAECFKSGLFSHLTVTKDLNKADAQQLVCLTDSEHKQALPPGEWTLENLGQPFTPR